MDTFQLKDMVKGWFIGGFEPCAFNTDAVEVGIKTYRAGDVESRHHHKVSTELTVVLNGCARLNGRQYNSGDILVIYPGEDTDFEALTDVVTVVVKLPGAQHDKYEGVAK